MIPRKDMTKIYADMFLLDEQISRCNLGRIADTTFVYGAVLEKYGYDEGDYKASQEKYLKDPGRYARMLKKSVEILKEQKKEFLKQKEKLDAIRDAERYRLRFAPHRIFLLDTLDYGVLFNFDFQKGMDTLWLGPRMVVPADTVKVEESEENVEV